MPTELAQAVNARRAEQQKLPLLFAALYPVLAYPSKLCGGKFVIYAVFLALAALAVNDKVVLQQTLHGGIARRVHF